MIKRKQVIVHGPPIVGKTTLSKLICEAYGLVYVSAETVAQDLLEDLVSYPTNLQNSFLYFTFI